MKKTIFITALLFGIAIKVMAQAPTLTYTNTAPVAGDSYSFLMADTSGISFGASGSNCTWDLSDLVIDTSLSEINWVSPATTPYTSSFPGATVSYSYSNGAYTLYSYQAANTSEWSLIGYASSVNTWSFDDPSNYFTFPFTYGGNFTDPHHATSYYGGTMHYKRGTRNVSADAWGTLILPSGTYGNLLRVKTVFVEHDSSSLGESSSNVINYDWYDGVNKSPVIEMGYIYNESAAIIYRSIKVSSAYCAIPESENSESSFRLMPVPATGFITFDTEEQDPVFIQISDLSGKIVFGNAFYEKNARIDISSLPSGMYIVKARLNNETVTRKLIKF